MRQVFSGQHSYSTSRKMMSIKEPPYRVGFIYGKLTTEKETSLASTADRILSKVNKQDTGKLTVKLFQYKVSSPS